MMIFLYQKLQSNHYIGVSYYLLSFSIFILKLFLWPWIFKNDINLMIKMSKQARHSEDEHPLDHLGTQRETKLHKDSLRNSKVHRANLKSCSDKLEGSRDQSGRPAAATHWLLPDLSFSKISWLTSVIWKVWMASCPISALARKQGSLLTVENYHLILLNQHTGGYKRIWFWWGV